MEVCLRDANILKIANKIAFSAVASPAVMCGGRRAATSRLRPGLKHMLPMKALHWLPEAARIGETYYGRTLTKYRSSIHGLMHVCTEYICTMIAVYICRRYSGICLVHTIGPLHVSPGTVDRVVDAFVDHVQVRQPVPVLRSRQVARPAQHPMAMNRGICHEAGVWRPG